MANKNGGFIGTDGLDAPDPPTAVTPTVGDSSVSVAFTAPTDTGTSAITGFVAQVASSGDNYSAGSGTGTSSPITVSSLSNGTSYTAKVWAINAYGTSAPSDASDSFSPQAFRGLFSGDENSSRYNIIEYISIPSTGNATDFGDITGASPAMGSAASSTRAVFKGSGSAGSNTITYVTIATTGNSSTFGNAVEQSQYSAGCSNDTRALFSGGINQSGGNSVNSIEYVTIANTGNGTDFGNMTTVKKIHASLASTTRGIFAGGFDNGGNRQNVIDYVTIGSTGNASDFGNLTGNQNYFGGCASTTRGVLGIGDFNDDTNINTIQYITIASTGNASDFGDASVGRIANGTLSSTTRGVFGGGNPQDGSGTLSNVMDYVTIASTGNATDFGDLATARSYVTGCSNCHGGLG